MIVSVGLQIGQCEHFEQYMEVLVLVSTFVKEMQLSDFIGLSTLLELAQGLGIVTPDSLSSGDLGGV